MPTVKNLYVLFGGTGFIGTNIFNQLLHDDTYFLVVDRESNIRFINDMPEELKRHVTNYNHHLDFTNDDGYKYVETTIKNFINETIKVEDPSDRFEWNITFIHLASTVGVEWNVSGNFRSEMRITQNIIQIIKDLLVDVNDLFKKINICYTSTSELFGENSHKISNHLSIEKQEDLFDLSCLYSPKFAERSEYIYQKYIGERLFKSLQTQLDMYSGIHIFILRLFNIIGPFQYTNKGVFSKFIVELILGKTSTCSVSIRRYVPVEAVTDFFNPYSKSLFGVIPKGLNYVLFTGHEKLLCGTGQELYIHLKNYLKQKYPNSKGLQKSSYILDQGEDKNGIDNPKEIMQRFEKRILTNSEFEQYYGHFIESIIEMQIKYGPLTREALGTNIKIKDQGETIEVEEFPGKVTQYNDGLALISGLVDYSAGDLILFENGEKGLLSDTEETPTCVILGKGDNIKIGLKCKLNGKLKLPKMVRTKK